MNTRERSMDEVRAVEVEAAATRQRVGEDLEALGDKLTPENLKQGIKSEAKEVMVQAKDTALEKANEVKESVEDAGRATLEFAGRNRIPLALIGAGLGWLIATRGRGDGRLRRRARTVFSGETYEGGYERTPAQRAEGWMHEGAERTRQLSDQAVERTRQLSDQAVERTRQLSDQVGETAARLGRRSREFGRESPLAVGALSLAAGLGVGLALPTTRKEEQLLGPTRDRLVGQARGTAEEIGQTVKGTAREIKQKLNEPMTH